MARAATNRGRWFIASKTLDMAAKDKAIGRGKQPGYFNTRAGNRFCGSPAKQRLKSPNAKPFKWRKREACEIAGQNKGPSCSGQFETFKRHAQSIMALR